MKIFSSSPISGNSLAIETGKPPLFGQFRALLAHVYPLFSVSSLIEPPPKLCHLPETVEGGLGTSLYFETY